MMKFSGVDGAQDLVLQFMDMIDDRGQYDLLAGAKVSYDADCVLVPTGVNQAILCGPWQRENEDPPKFSLWATKNCFASPTGSLSGRGLAARGGVGQGSYCLHEGLHWTAEGEGWTLSDGRLADTSAALGTLSSELVR